MQLLKVSQQKVCRDTATVASFPGLSRFYARLVHAKHEREESSKNGKGLGPLVT